MITARPQSFSMVTLTFLALAGVLFLPFFSHAQTETTAPTSTATTTQATEVAVKQPARQTDPRALGYTVEGVPGSDEVIGDFVVGPGKVEVSLDPGESQMVELMVTNRTGVDRIFRFEAEDTAASRNGSSPIILLGDDRGPYSLKDYLDIPEQGLFIKHGQRVRIPVEVAIPPDAEPGGLYGSVIVQTAAVKKETTAENVVSQTPLVTRIGTLFFVIVGGGVEREGELVDFATIPADKTFFSSGPVSFALTYQNNGSIHTTPYGEIEIINLQGDQVGFEILEPWFVMPNSLRSREISWNREILFGKYKAIARINRGYDDIVDERVVEFWVIPWKPALLLLIGLLVLIFLLRLLLSRFEFKKKQKT